MVKVGIIGAMELEVSALKGQIKGITVKKKAGMEFCEGTIGGVKVVVVRCGIGKVNAALCVQILCDDFGVSHVINTGVAEYETNDGAVLLDVRTAEEYRDGHIDGSEQHG